MAAPRRRRDTDTDDDMTNGIPNTAILCPLCRSLDPQQSAVHYLKLVKERGLDTLRTHLTEQFMTLREPGKRRQDSVDATMAWVTTMVEQYSGMADPDTGAHMPWWKARQYMMDHRDQTAASSYAQAPQKYREHHEPLRPLKPTLKKVMPTAPLDDDPLGDESHG